MSNPGRTDRSRLRRRQVITIVLLFTGYAAYYFCRSDLSVAMPLLMDDLDWHGATSDRAVVHLGTIASLGFCVRDR